MATKFTTGIDALKGNTGDNEFIADRTSGEVLQSTDTADGGAGNDKLVVKK